MSYTEEFDDLLGDDILDRNIEEINTEEREKKEEDVENDENDDPTEESINKKIEIKKRIIRAPLPKLNAQRLSGPRGIISIEKHFEQFKFHGKNREKDDLNKIMTKLELWAHRLFPKYQFDDCLERIERLGKQRVIMSYMNMYRLNMLQPEDNNVAVQDNLDEDQNEELATPLDEMDEFLNEQIALAKTRDTINSEAAFNSLIASPSNSTFGLSPKPTSTPLHNMISNETSGLTDEQKKLIAINRQKAREKLLQKMLP
uniref:TIMELESS-interacting protein n=1 Tax=Xenopsylla cheopis TaxID=163159 RepID=A0A6M2DL61_XENCH